MNWQQVWDYFGSFDDREGFRIIVLMTFLFGTPLVVGITAKLWIWAIRQVRAAHQFLKEKPEVTRLEHGR